MATGDRHVAACYLSFHSHVRMVTYASLSVRPSVHSGRPSGPCVHSDRPSVHPCIRNVRPSVWTSVIPFVRSPVRPSVRQFFRPSVHPFVRSSLRPSDRPSVCSFVRPSSVRPSVRPSVSPSTLLHDITAFMTLRRIKCNLKYLSRMSNHVKFSFSIYFFIC